MTTIAEARKQARHARFVLDDSPGGVGDTLDLALDVLEKLGAAFQHDNEHDNDEMDDEAINLWHAVFVAHKAFEAGL